MNRHTPLPLLNSAKACEPTITASNATWRDEALLAVGTSFCCFLAAHLFYVGLFYVRPVPHPKSGTVQPLVRMLVQQVPLNALRPRSIAGSPKFGGEIELLMPITLWAAANELARSEEVMLHVKQQAKSDLSVVTWRQCAAANGHGRNIGIA